MPYIIRPPRRLNLVAGLLAAVACLAATPALARASCPSSETAQVFSKLGDFASYSLLQSGSFESGATGWTLRGASVTSGNQSTGIGAGGSHSLAIPPTGEAVSPSFCVGSEDPFFRFFTRRTSGTWGVLNVIVRWKDSSGTTHDTTSAALQLGPGWGATPVLQLGTMLPLWQPGSTLQVQIVLRPEAYGGAWAVDDVYIDPYRT